FIGEVFVVNGNELRRESIHAESRLKPLKEAVHELSAPFGVIKQVSHVGLHLLSHLRHHLSLGLCTQGICPRHLEKAPNISFLSRIDLLFPRRLPCGGRRWLRCRLRRLRLLRLVLRERRQRRKDHSGKRNTESHGCLPDVSVAQNACAS